MMRTRLLRPGARVLNTDAYVPLMGNRHSWGLGRACRELLPESWCFVGPLFDRVMTLGQDTTSLIDPLIIV